MSRLRRLAASLALAAALLTTAAAQAATQWTADPARSKLGFTGTLTAADERTVSVDAGGEAVEIPLDRVRRSNLVPEPPEVPQT